VESLHDRLKQFVGLEAEPPRVARYAVNDAMIRNWAEAHEDENPVYVDDRAARVSGRAGIVCPPAMISTWIMAGLRRYRQIQRLRAEGGTENFPYSQLLALLDEAGYTSVVATNLEQNYLREARPGDRVRCHFTIDDISPVKQTALGNGCFITLRKRYVDQDGEPLVEERFRMLRFDPGRKEAVA
jgi:acyl dehydratase